MHTTSDSAPDVPVGNTFDKYASSSLFVRRLMAGFETDLDELLALAQPRSILDFGCGEGVLTERWAGRFVDRRIVGVDLDHPGLAAEWERRRRPPLEFRAYGGGALPFADDEFELVAAIEVLEHVRDPEATVAELKRVAQRSLLVSVPREPLWRMLNVARGAYVRELGNTPGHLGHWSRRAIVDLLGSFGRIEQVRSPFPWTQVLVDVG